jgi:hypothetical protein
MPTSKCIALVFAAIALTGCCALGNGCYAPVSGTPIAWDGLGPAPPETEENYKPKRASRRNTEIIVRPLNEVTAPSDDRKSQSKDEWTRQQAADQAADAKLTNRLKICRGC